MAFKIYKNDILFSFLISFFFLFIYLLCLNDNMSHAHDAETYYERILSQPAWHGNHLIYEFCARAWHDFLRLILPDTISSFRLIASMNSVFGAVLTGIIYLYCHKALLFSKTYSLLTVCMIGFSFYFLTYSATVEIYMPVLCFSFLALLCARAMKLTFSAEIIIGLLHGVAMLWHQMAFLFGFVIILCFWSRGRVGLFYILTGSFIVLSGYGIAAWDLNLTDFEGIKKLFSGYLVSDDVLSDRQNSPPHLSIFGLGMALLGGRILMGLEPFKTILETYFAGHGFERLIYLHHQTSSIEIIIQIGAYALCALCLFYMIYHYCRIEKIFKAVSDLWILLIIHSAFFIFWFPHNPEFWAVQMICLIGIIMQTRPNLKISFVTMMVIAVINIMGSALPLKNPQNDIFYRDNVVK